jgi:NADH dehydrogenase
MSARTVLVVGGAGFLGRRVVQRLLARGDAVRVLVRPDTRDPQEIAGADRVLGDVTDRESLRRALHRADAVVSCAGTIADRMPDTFERVHAVGTRTLVAAAEPGMPSVLVSALGARPHAGSAFLRTKAAGEMALRNSRLAWRVLRPAPIWGDADHLVWPITRVLRRTPMLPAPGPAARRLQPIHVEDMAAAAVEALDRDEAAEQVIDLVGREVVTWGALAGRIARAVGRRGRVLHLPTAVTVQAPLLLQAVGMTPLLARDPLTGAVEDLVGDAGVAQRLLGLAPAGLDHRLEAVVEACP